MKKPYLFGVLTVLTLSSLCAHAMEKETDDDSQFTGVPVFYPAVLDRHEFMESISDARPLSLKKEQFLGVYRKDPYLISNEAIAQLTQGYNPNYSQMILLVKNDKYNENGVKYPIPKAGMYVYEVKEFGQWEKYGEEFNITFLHEEAAQQIEALLPKEVGVTSRRYTPFLAFCGRPIHIWSKRIYFDKAFLRKIRLREKSRFLFLGFTNND